jgi:hypothetical protein
MAIKREKKTIFTEPKQYHVASKGTHKSARMQTKAARTKNTHNLSRKT